MERFGPAIDVHIAHMVDSGSYWLAPEAGVLVAWRSDRKLVAISLRDGTIRWEIETAGRIVLEGPPARPSVVSVRGDAIEVYTFGASSDTSSTAGSVPP
jgi:hypothetical protein